jgi:hypothetical protein
MASVSINGNVGEFLVVCRDGNCSGILAICISLIPGYYEPKQILCLDGQEKLQESCLLVNALVGADLGAEIARCRDRRSKEIKLIRRFVEVTSPW